MECQRSTVKQNKEKIDCKYHAKSPVKQKKKKRKKKERKKKERKKRKKTQKNYLLEHSTEAQYTV